MFNLKVILVRAVVTAAEAAFAVIIAAGFTGLNVETAEAAVLSGAAAGLSVLYNAVRQWLDSQAAVDSAQAERPLAT